MDLFVHAVLLAFAMPKKKYYAVSAGRKVGVFQSWEECKKQVNEKIFVWSINGSLSP
jgi:hypothetical protein